MTKNIEYIVGSDKETLKIYGLTLVKNYITLDNGARIRGKCFLNEEEIEYWYYNPTHGELIITNSINK